MSDVFNEADYRSLPRFDAAGGLSLAQALAAAAPSNRAPRLDRALTALNAAATELNTAFAGKLSPATPTADTRGADLRIDHHWTALYQRLNAWTLHDANEPEVARAQALIQAIFPDGLGFLKLTYEREWAESQRRIDLIHNQGIDAEVGDLAGRLFFSRLTEAHRAYGKALGITAAAAAPAATRSLAAGLRKLTDAMGGYVLQLLANFDPADANELAALRSALQPIDNFRARAASRDHGGAKDQAAPTSPVAAKA